VIRSSTPWLAALLVAATGSAGCSGTAPRAAVPVPAAAAAPAPGANPGDVHFITGMIHHHGQALTMAELVPDRASSSSIRLLAERIHVSQTDEIRLMQQWLRDHGEEAPEPSPTGMRMVHGGVEHDMLMAGMLTPEQLAQLEAARGAEFDRLFLTFMIQHHEGALTMVEELFATPGAANDTFIYKFASDAFADQGTEIDRMERMLEAMAGQNP
jgi:uncharacterized protein (DUF305 family)